MRKLIDSVTMINKLAGKIINTGIDFPHMPYERTDSIPQVNFLQAFNAETLKRTPKTTPPPVYYPIGTGGGK